MNNVNCAQQCELCTAQRQLVEGAICVECIAFCLGAASQVERGNVHNSTSIFTFLNFAKVYQILILKSLF